MLSQRQVLTKGHLPLAQAPCSGWGATSEANVELRWDTAKSKSQAGGARSASFNED
jgi:hypothetical protein